MKVLSDWYTGTPPKPGLWLVRSIAGRVWDAGSMAHWDGSRFRDLDGSLVGEHLGRDEIEYRGLAFDPEAARITCEYGSQALWIVTEPKP